MENKHDDYTVGWISALPKEQAAVLLDDTHDKLPIDRHDTTYLLGRIDVHNVVLACLPSMGTSAAARCAARLQSGFKSLRFILMVGVGGGVPTKHDIRLGDVVVSMSTKKYRGVVQYDFGTKFQDSHCEIIDTHLSKPPDILVTAVSTLNTKSVQDEEIGPRLSRYVDELARKSSSLEASRRPQQDQLYNAKYIHLDRDRTCEECKCDSSQTVDRKARTGGNHPKVYQGLIASGNEVMRDALERDRLAKEADVLCFEMEAAGLMTDLGCLVIRGICDYCDSHKNKTWQEHAAAVAAAYAKELLKVVPGLKENTSLREKHDSLAKGSIYQGGNVFHGSTFASNSQVNQGNFVGFGSLGAWQRR